MSFNFRSLQTSLARVCGDNARKRVMRKFCPYLRPSVRLSVALLHGDEAAKPPSHVKNGLPHACSAFVGIFKKPGKSISMKFYLA